VKPPDHLLRFRLHAPAQQTTEQPAVRGMGINRVQQVGSATVVKEKQTLSQAPCAETEEFSHVSSAASRCCCVTALITQ